VDVIIGRPAGPEFFYIRAGSEAMPVVTDIPYQIDAPFTARVHAFVAAAHASA